MSLIYKLLIVNIAGLAITASFAFLGYVTQALNADVTYLVEVNIAIFTFGVFATFWRANKLRLAFYDNYYDFTGRNQFIDDIPSILTTIGLLGTMIGFVIGFEGVSDLEKDLPLIITGFKTAIWTTIVAGYLSIWMEINKRMLFTATTKWFYEGK